ncbi:MAG: hypothetical protein LAN71_06005 [Acidobacteriia bacterium]|nr:hypothetical protein [Terriglobia bacterium]
MQHSTLEFAKAFPKYQHGFVELMRGLIQRIQQAGRALRVTLGGDSVPLAGAWVVGHHVDPQRQGLLHQHVLASRCRGDGVQRRVGPKSCDCG